MGKFWRFIKALLSALFRLKEESEAEVEQETAQAQEKLRDWEDRIAREVRDNEAQAHQEIIDSQGINGGRAAALRRLERLRRKPAGSPGDDQG